MDKCRNCRYSTPVEMGENNQMLRGCVYILRTGTRRPCPGGTDCSVYRPRRRIRR